MQHRYIHTDKDSNKSSITNNILQVLSETVASALQFLDDDNTCETRKMIRMMDIFFDCLNVKNPLEHKLKRKDSRAPYCKVNDWRFKVCESYQLINVEIIIMSIINI